MNQAVILAGGSGTRLKEITGYLPKPLVNVNKKPLLGYIIDSCRKYNFRKITLLLSYQSNLIVEFCENSEYDDIEFEYLIEDSPRGTGGALIDALKSLDERFVVIYADTYFEINFSSFIDFHDKNNADASIFIHPNDHPMDSDLVEIDDQQRIIKIHPYPHDNNWRSNLVNAAVYIFQKNTLLNVNIAKEKFDIAKDIFPNIIKSNRVYGYISTEYIKDVGTPRRLSNVEKDIQSGKVNMLNKANSRRAIFLDRDGVINREIGHLSNINNFQLLKGVSEAISLINQSGYLAVIVTNQPVIARGELSIEGLNEIHRKMETLLGIDGAYLDRIYFCPHHPEQGFDGEIEVLKINCFCRKPDIGMLEEAKKDLNIEFTDSWLIGDSERDIIAASKTHLKSILVRKNGLDYAVMRDIKPTYQKDNLLDAVKFILKN